MTHRQMVKIWLWVINGNLSSGLCDKLYDGIKFIVMSENHGMTMTLLEFYDIIVGQEPAEDFAEENVEHIKRLSKCVIGWFRKKIPGKND